MAASQSKNSIRCIDNDCRKRIPRGLYYCPYCGMPALQNVLPSPETSRQTVIVAMLLFACLGVGLLLFQQVNDLVTVAFATPTKVITPTAVPTHTTVPTRTPFPKMPRPLASAQTSTPMPTATNVTVRGVTSRVDATGVIITPFRLYTHPAYESDVLREFTAGSRLKILGKHPELDWLQVETPDDIGWVNAGLIELEEPWTIDVLPFAMP